MRARYKAPSGTGVLELPDDATVQDVFSEIRAKTEISHFSLKYGPPMAMKSISAVDYAHQAKSLGLHGETLTVVPDEARPEPPSETSNTRSSQPVQSFMEPRERSSRSGEKPEDVVVPWPEREGTLRMCPNIQYFCLVA